MQSLRIKLYEIRPEPICPRRPKNSRAVSLALVRLPRPMARRTTTMKSRCGFSNGTPQSASTELSGKSARNPKSRNSSKRSEIGLLLMGWTGCFPRRVSLQRLLPAIDKRSSSWIPPHRPSPRSASISARMSSTLLASIPTARSRSPQDQASGASRGVQDPAAPASWAWRPASALILSVAFFASSAISLGSFRQST